MAEQDDEFLPGEDAEWEDSSHQRGQDLNWSFDAAFLTLSLLDSVHALLISNVVSVGMKRLAY